MVVWLNIKVMQTGSSNETRQRGRVKKTWWDCVRGRVVSIGLFHKDAEDRDQLKLRIKGNWVTQVNLENGHYFVLSIFWVLEDNIIIYLISV